MTAAAQIQIQDSYQLIVRAVTFGKVLGRNVNYMAMVELLFSVRRLDDHNNG